MPVPQPATVRPGPDRSLCSLLPYLASLIPIRKLQSVFGAGLRKRHIQILIQKPIGSKQLGAATNGQKNLLSVFALPI